jgi:SOS-response transcriptional repressor LexA
MKSYIKSFLNHSLDISSDRTKAQTQCYYFQITDDSMEAVTGTTFPVNALIGIHPLRTPKHQDFVIARAGKLTEPIFRQLLVKNRQLFLHALNPNYLDIEMNSPDIIYGVLCQFIELR